MYIYIHKYRKDKKDRPRNCVLLCVKSFKACIRRVIVKYLSCKLSKEMYYYTRKRGNHFYQCFVQFYIILIHKFVVSRSFKIRFCSDLFGLSTLRTIDPSDCWPFGPLTLRTNERTWYNPMYRDTQNNTLRYINNPSSTKQQRDHL